MPSVAGQALVLRIRFGAETSALGFHSRDSSLKFQSCQLAYTLDRFFKDFYTCVLVLTSAHINWRLKTIAQYTLLSVLTITQYTLNTVIFVASG